MGDRRRIGIRDVRALQPGEIIWDGAVTGFGARRQRDTVAYILKYRTQDGRQRWHTIGRHGSPWTPDQARDEARRLLGEVVRGADPAGDKQERRKAATVADLLDQYHEDAKAGHVLVRGGKPKKPGTIEFDRCAIEAHIRPLLGTLKVAALTRADVETFMRAVADGKTARQTKTKPRGVSRIRGGRGIATRVVGLLGAVFTYSVERGMRPDNPVSRVRKYAENKRDRRLTDREYAQLGAGLRDAEGTILPPAVACLRFLALTGWRSGEALALRWRDVDLDRRTANLSDTKTGASTRPLSHAACELLQAQSRMTNDTLVFPPSRGNGVLSGKGFARRIIAKSGLPSDITAHVLRHSFASIAADLEYGESTIAALLGHRGRSVTSRYTHAADAVLLAAADAVAGRISSLMSARTETETET